MILPERRHIPEPGQQPAQAAAGFVPRQAGQIGRRLPGLQPQPGQSGQDSHRVAVPILADGGVEERVERGSALTHLVHCRHGVVLSRQGGPEA